MLAYVLSSRRLPAAAALAAGLAVGASASAQTCIDPAVTPSFEEQRLVNMLPGTTVPAPTLIMEASGFNTFGPEFIEKLCGVPKTPSPKKRWHHDDDDDDDDDGGSRWKIKPPSSYKQALELMKKEGHDLWRAAVDRAQGRKVMGTLPASDDRPLYWARLTMTKALRQWVPAGFSLTPEQRAELHKTLDRHSRGQHDIKFPSSRKYKRVIVSGFDPFSLGNPGSTSTGVRIGNPSGANALSLDGNRIRLADGTWVAVETYILVVNYTEFNEGMVEDTVGPFYAATARKGRWGHRHHHDDDDDDDDDGGDGRGQAIDASISVSQGGGFRFNLEQWNGRFHGPSAGNDGGVECPGPNSARLPYNPPGCNVYPPARWLGYEPRLCNEPVKECWMMQRPPQFTSATLPIDSMIRAQTGKVGGSFQRPPGNTHPIPDEVYGVAWGTDYSYFPNCDVPMTASRNPTPSADVYVYPHPTLDIPPGSQECARQGAGGDYLSNEVAYRNTLMRDRFGLSIPAGHIHVPVMTRFGTNPNPGNGEPSNVITDPTFEAYRDTIVEQTRRLIFVVAQNLDEGVPPVGMPPN